MTTITKGDIMERPLTNTDAIALLRREIERGSPYSPAPNGRKQIGRDTWTLIHTWSRRDAVGRYSRNDERAIREAIAELTDSGELAGELNGYLLA